MTGTPAQQDVEPLRRSERWMRCSLAAWALALCALASGSRAQSSGDLQIRLQPPARLTLNAHAPIIALVQLPSGSADLPLMLTPRIEGAAVELVRGRLLRSDAKQTDPTHLRFEIPVVARSAGTAILRVSVATYLCTDTCRRVEALGSAVLEVR
jgi:hypothetical protein